MYSHETLNFRRARFVNRRLNANRVIDAQALTKAKKAFTNLPIVSSEMPPTLPGAPVPTNSTGVFWKQIGPQPLRIDAEQIFQGTGPVSGEVVDFAIDRTSPGDQTIYIVTNDGGVWKTIDGGSHWLPMTEEMPVMSMGAIVIDPTDSSVIYAATGNDYDGGALFSKGAGIYRSVDSGFTWLHLSETLFTNVNITRMMMPAHDVLLVASVNGLFRSVDGGVSFGNNSPLFNNGTPILAGRINDLELDLLDVTQVYACIDGVGIMKSTDAGVTFPTNLFSNTGAPSAPFNRIVVAQSLKPNSDTLFAMVTDSTASPPFKGLFKSTDRGLTWNLLPGAQGRAAENGGLQADYDLTLGVDPGDANRVYIGFQELYLSTDGGNTFGTPATSQNKIHWDHHAMSFGSTISTKTTIYVGMDGGLASSSDGGVTWTNLNETIATNLFLGIDMGRGSAANNVFTYGGCQDTGTKGRRPGMTGNDWHMGTNGDGGPVAVDVDNPLMVYGRSNGSLIFTADGGVNWSVYTPAGSLLPAHSSIAGRVAGSPLAVDRNNKNIVFVASGSQLFISIDRGVTFPHQVTFANSLTAFAISQFDSKVLMVGCSDGTVHRSSNANNLTAVAPTAPTFTDLTAKLTTAGAVALRVGGIAFDTLDAKIAVVVFQGASGVAAPARSKHVFRTTDAGVTWADISGTDGVAATNFPDLPCNSVLIDTSNDPSPHAILVATVSGVLRSTDTGATWHRFGLGLPQVDCTSIICDEASSPRLIRVGTYGRSVFELTRPAVGKLVLQGNLAFATSNVGSSTDKTVDLVNVGGAAINISSITADALFANTTFTLKSPPAFPFVLAAGATLTLTFNFSPSNVGTDINLFSVTSDDSEQPKIDIWMSATVANNAIAVTGLIPAAGPSTGGTSVKVLGSQFTGATAVAFDTTAATSFTVDNDNQITAISPPGIGAIDVIVTTPAGSSPKTAGSKFKYGATGVLITGIAPKNGPDSGGTVVTLTGAGFSAVTKVLFGTFQASSFTIDSDTQLTAVAPAASGDVNILLVHPGGTTALNPLAIFKFEKAGTPGGIGTTTGTTDAATAGSVENEILSVMADILRTSTDPEVLNAQRILMRRIALGGDVVPSRIPAPKNITEVGGYINLLTTLGMHDIRTEMIASTLGVASGRDILSGLQDGPTFAFVNILNDRPLLGAAARTTPPRISIRGDMVDVLVTALDSLRAMGCQLPLLTPIRQLPQKQPGIATPKIDNLAAIGRTLDIVPDAWLLAPPTDSVVLARQAAEGDDKARLYCRAVDTSSTLPVLNWVLLQGTTTGLVALADASHQLQAIEPVLAQAGWFPIEPVQPTLSVTDRGSMGRWVNVTGLIVGETKLKDELSLCYTSAQISASVLVDRLNWVWNGADFAAKS